MVMESEKSAGKKAVLITGASSGIGRESALMLCRAGFRVFAGVRSTENGEALINECPEGLSWVLIDVTDQASIAAAKERVIKEAGGLWGLMANSGIAVSGPLELVSVEDMKREFDVNVFGVMSTIQAFLPLIRESRGRIVITGSQGGRMGLPMIGAYNASKFALEAVADAFRMELRKFGIRVSLLEPGSIATPIWDKNLADSGRMNERLSAEERERYRAELIGTDRMSRLQARLAIHPAKAARRVLHAMSSSRPKPRYLIGLDARLNLFANAVLPTFIKDFVIRFGLERFGRYATSKVDN